MSELEAILNSGEPYRAKVTALIAAVERRDPVALPLARARVGVEPDAFVRATLVSTIGKLGDPTDRELLLTCLNDRENRVVANALEALLRLGMSLTLEQLAGFLDHADARVTGAALTLLSAQEPDRVLDRVELLLANAEPTRTVSLCRVLSALLETPRARALLLATLERTTSTAVMKHIVGLLKAESPTKHLPEVMGFLKRLADRAQGDRQALARQLLQDLAVTFGWSESQVCGAALEQSSAMPPPEPVVRPSRQLPVTGAPSRPSRQVAAPAPPRSRARAAAWATALLAACAVGYQLRPDRPGHGDSAEIAAARGTAPSAGAVAATRAAAGEGSMFSGAAPAYPRPEPAAGETLEIDGRVIGVRDSGVLVRTAQFLVALAGPEAAGLRRGDPVRARGRVSAVEGRLIKVVSLR